MLPFLALLAATALGQNPASTSEADALEAKHLTNIRQVTSGFGRAGEGYFSPDGRSVIFQAAPTAQGDYQIYTQDLAPDSKPKLVSTGKGKCTCSYFHPDGKSILFASTHLDPALSSPDAKPKGPAYSRSERYRWDFDPAMDIFKGDLDGKNLVRLTDTPGYDAEGSYSPDAKQIIFTSFRDGDAEIYIMDADGKNPRRITHSKGYDGGPFFSPDGKKILYRSDRKENDLLQVFINTPDGKNERQLTDNGFVNWGPYFFKDSRHIVYATSRHGHQNYEIYWMDTDTGKEERITYREGFDGLPVFDRDGTRMMWTSKGRAADKTSQLFIADFVAPKAR
jgi:Tol biopolymer transport system component